MDAVSYQNIQNMISLLKLISQGEKNITEGRFTSQDEFFKLFEKKNIKITIMKYNVFWTKTAQNNLSSIYDYLVVHEYENVALDIYERIKKKH